MQAQRRIHWSRPATELDTRRPAIGAWIVGGFEHAVRMQYECTGMTDRIGKRHIVAGREQPVDDVAVELLLDHEVAGVRAPGAAEVPARPLDRLIERFPVEHVAREQGGLDL